MLSVIYINMKDVKYMFQQEKIGLKIECAL